MLLEVLHEVIDVLADLKAINGSRQAELHAKLEQAVEDIAPAEASPVQETPPA